jgi:hypothetical protein
LANILFLYFVSVGQRLFSSLKAQQKEENLPGNSKPCIVPHLLYDLEKQKSIVLQLINNISCVN